ncbi:MULTISPECIES: DUF5983 family protein [Ralstonia]|jgi:hypothetical protein|uniref:DUF5983 domain-containing protein n=2 Tax=Ralstonia pickettii TaxID=329 RepID=R0DWB7_RALPI|nr:hypothetical protein [Ralstonia pickettii]ENZ77703.1 hypothetical protein OR214_01979 [Ralstonia pickettii OR214]MCM3583896.1 hypothetical protein [Ralstonia pickettii]
MQNNQVLIPAHLVHALVAFAKAQGHDGNTPARDSTQPADVRPTSVLPPVGDAVREVEALLAASKGGFTDIAAVPCISTCHISVETNAMLEQTGDRTLWFYGQYESGYWIRVPHEDPTTAADPFWLAAPDDIRSLWSWARERSYFWLRLDADGTQVDGLPVYNWEFTTDVDG